VRQVLLTMADENQWYTNKDLFEMFNNIKNDIQKLSLEMKETKILIRDYNGLRKNNNMS
jgi:hypothetical protein